MPNFYQGAASDPGIIDSVFDAVGNIGSIFGQLLFVTFWLSLFLIGAGALFLIWLNVRHAKECDVQDSQDTRTEDLLRELAPADQRFSIVGGKAVKFEGEIPEMQEPASGDSADVDLPGAFPVEPKAGQPLEIEIDIPGAAIKTNLAQGYSTAEPPAASGKVSTEPIDEKLKYAPPIAPPGSSSNSEK